MISGSEEKLHYNVLLFFSLSMFYVQSNFSFFVSMYLVVDTAKWNIRERLNDGKEAIRHMIFFYFSSLFNLIVI